MVRMSVCVRVRSILMVYWLCRGDQHDPEIVEYFLDQNILGYFGMILEDPENRKGDVAIQILQV